MISGMEILPSVKSKYWRIPPWHNRCCLVNSNTKSPVFFNSQANSICWSSCNFQQIDVRKLVVRSSKDESGSIAQQGLESLPLSMELLPISSESHFDRIVAEAQQQEESVVILWMASWCRKCIYLKPKLEKLAAEYYPRVRFYSVDVNSVPYKLIVRAEVTKMPTIQLWRDGKKQGEVIGGHKAYLVVNEVREIIENENSL